MGEPTYSMEKLYQTNRTLLARSLNMNHRQNFRRHIRPLPRSAIKTSLLSLRFRAGMPRGFNGVIIQVELGARAMLTAFPDVARDGWGKINVLGWMDNRFARFGPRLRGVGALAAQ